GPPYLPPFPTRRSSDLYRVLSHPGAGRGEGPAVGEPAGGRPGPAGARGGLAAALPAVPGPVGLGVPHRKQPADAGRNPRDAGTRSEEHTSELQSRENLV